MILRSDVLMFHSWHQSVSTIIFETESSWIFLNKLESVTNILFIGFVKFETKSWFLTILHVTPVLWLVWSRSTALLGLLESFFQPFSKTETASSFFSPLLVPVQCLDRTFCASGLSLAQSRKTISYFSKLCATLKREEKNSVMMASFVYLSSNWS